MSDPNQGTTRPGGADLPPVEPDAAPPRLIGRYRVDGVLGQGTFGIVYRAYDDVLQRWVAIKVPHRTLLMRPQDAEPYLAEARTVARLEHPHIVPVYDVGSTDAFPCFVVSRLVEGTTLAEKIRPQRLPLGKAVEIAAAVLDALHYAHRHGIVHRDIKPGNILLDVDGKPFVADFGLALKEENAGRGPGFAGTPAYMSPEQARGEGHRVDGRSDVFSTGVVLYELLTGRRPFHGNNQAELLDAICTREARPPRQWDDAIPKELERICLKALARRISDRYTTARDMSEDLRFYLAQLTPEHASGVPPASPSASSAPPGSPAPAAPAATSGRPSPPVIPKGLRAFDGHDAEFFLTLLPGPRDRNGLPESLRFWKTRIEDASSGNAFTVGLIYGPSGCGKTSFLKAGLLPRLSDAVIPVVVEASAEATEMRLLAGLRRACPGLGGCSGVKDAVGALRRGQAVPEGRHVLLVLDQLEQWLHAHRPEANAELIQALRQCDGNRVRCLVLVRDDFWMAATRFMQELEVPLVEGGNSAPIHLFDLDHARRVLVEFGRAFGKFPDRSEDFTTPQQEFLERAVAGLAQDGKVVCVRLALFAEMLKGKPWTPPTLKAVGGPEGVGVAFLEDTFCSPAAPPKHRYHQRAARADLQALLPETGDDLRGHMRSYAELLEASGYGARPRDFDDLIHILDNEIRLITPSEPPGTGPADDASRPPGQADQKYYQLTHDYLVHSIRTWLESKQKETRRGRAELLLADCAAHWRLWPRDRNLPSLLQWLRILLLTRAGTWTGDQQRMMQRAARVHVARGLLAVVSLLVLGLFAWQTLGRHEARVLRDRLLEASPEDVPAITRAMGPYRRWVDPLVRHDYDRADSPADRKKRLHAALALAPVDPSLKDYLFTRLLDCDSGEFGVVLDALQPHRDELIDPLWAVLEQPGATGSGRRLRAACALAHFDPTSDRWTACRDQAASDLVAAPVGSLGTWGKLLRPVRQGLQAPLVAIFRDGQRQELNRSVAAGLLADYASDQPELLTLLLLEAGDRQFDAMIPQLADLGEKIQTPLLKELASSEPAPWPDPPLDPSWPGAEAHLVKQVERAHGGVAERFAFCLQLSLEDFPALAEGLRTAGYRPVRFRPYSIGSSRKAAAVWTRDGRPWKLAWDLSAEAMRDQDREHASRSFWPVDVAGYLSNGLLLYAGLWRFDDSDQPIARMAVGLPFSSAQAHRAVPRLNGYVPSVVAVQGNGAGQDFVSLVWTRAVPGSGPAHGWWSMQDGKTVMGDRPGELLDVLQGKSLGHLQVDVQLAGPRSAMPTTAEKFNRQLALADDRLRAAPQDVQARFLRAEARFQLGRHEEALADFDWLCANHADTAKYHRGRTIVLARLGRAEQARTSLAKFEQTAGNAEREYTLDYVQALVSLYLGDEIDGLRRLEARLRTRKEEASFYLRSGLYNAACVYARAVEHLAGRGPGDPAREDAAASRQQSYIDRAVALLKQALAAGYLDYDEMMTDPDLDPIRGRPAFRALLHELPVGLRHGRVWSDDARFHAVEAPCRDPAEGLECCRPLLAAGFRPVAVAAASSDGTGAAHLVLLWHGPAPSREQAAHASRRRARAAAALVRLGRPDCLTSLLESSCDPTARSRFLHAVGTLEIDPRVFHDLLQQKTAGAAARRGALLALGGFAPDRLGPNQQEALLPLVLDGYRTDADAGVHAAAEWLLRRWSKGDQLAAIDRALARTRPDAGGAPAPGADPVAAGWYVNGEGQTLVVLARPKPFWMGSPATESERSVSEDWRAVSTLRPFAIAAKPVTVEQFLRFRPAHVFRKDYGPSGDCPVANVSWYEAAEYCNWLSRQEGLPEKQWCYLPNPAGQYAHGMMLAPDFLTRRGYRLPTEAEWEYACRAGALTRWHFGEAEEMLAHYGWTDVTSQRRTWPAGRLQPNDFGLFDVHGDVMNWCQDLAGDRELLGIGSRADPFSIPEVLDSGSRLLRGGSFLNGPASARSAWRFWAAPKSRFNDTGLRPARWLP